MRQPISSVLGHRLALIGALASGKDTTALKLRYFPIGFADPIYELCGWRDKTLPGARETMQRIGQWGRGVVSNQYPITVERRLWAEYMSEWVEDHKVWGLRASEYGTPDFWLNGLFRRHLPAEKAAITNVRFDNERARAIDEGWQVVLVVCSDAEELEMRQLRACGGDLNRSVDVSETFSRDLSKHFVHAIEGFSESGKLLERMEVSAVIDTAARPHRECVNTTHVRGTRIPYFTTADISA